MIFIIGIDHRYQTGRGVNPSKFADFKKAIADLLTKEKAWVLAEEFSLEAAAKCGITKSVSQELAENYRVRYILADPDSGERKALGIRSRQETAESLGIYSIYAPSQDEEEKINAYHRDADEEREKEWLRRIEPYLGQPMIFICGFSHAEPLSQLLKTHGHECQINKLYAKV